jgi:hypothetical protein
MARSTRKNALGRNHGPNGKFLSRKQRTRKHPEHKQTIGSRAQVMHGTAHHTSGGLTKADLKQKPDGRIVSRKASAAGQKALQRLKASGKMAKPFTKKGSRRD